jgi:hypothetical protein
MLDTMTMETYEITVFVIVVVEIVASLLCLLREINLLATGASTDYILKINLLHVYIVSLSELYHTITVLFLPGVSRATEKKRRHTSSSSGSSSSISSPSSPESISSSWGSTGFSSTALPLPLMSLYPSSATVKSDASRGLTWLVSPGEYGGWWYLLRP